MTDWSRWSNKTIKSSFSGFLAEAGQFLSGDPIEIAHQKGWSGDNFGWFRDKGGQVVARSIGGRMVVYDGNGNTNLPAQTDMGNPAVTAGQEPAERARSMGLQSNGKGGYIDDSGNVVARTVNGELIFYDSGPGGGAVSDGAGGQALVQSQPSWVDPDSGLIMVPPAQPETPEEMAATPDPLPATPPMGFDRFVTQKHKQVKADIQAKREADADIAAQQEEADAPYEGAMKPLKLKLEGIIKRGEESGSKYKAGIAALMRDKMNENGQKLEEYYNTIPAEQHSELESLVISQMMNEVKHEFWVDNFKVKEDKAMAEGDYEKAEKIASFNTSQHLKDQQVIDSMMDEALGIKDIKHKKIKRKTWGDRGVTFYGTDDVKFFDEDNDEDERKYREILSAASDVTRKYGLKNPKQILNVNWDSAGEDDDSKDDKRRQAMDALYTWRQDVLPDLPDGMVVANKPVGGDKGKRARIYKIAGFSDVLDEYSGYQVGVVVTDENGVKRVIPVDPDTPLKENLALEYMNIKLIENIKLNRYDTVNYIYESFFS